MFTDANDSQLLPLIKLIHSIRNIALILLLLLLILFHLYLPFARCITAIIYFTLK